MWRGITPIPVRTRPVMAPVFLPPAERVAVSLPAKVGPYATATSHDFPGPRLVSVQASAVSRLTRTEPSIFAAVPFIFELRPGGRGSARRLFYTAPDLTFGSDPLSFAVLLLEAPCTPSFARAGNN